MLHSIFTGLFSQKNKNEIINQDSEFTNIREYRQRMTIREYHQSIAHRVYHQRMSSDLAIRVYHGKFVSNTYCNLTIEI